MGSTSALRPLLVLCASVTLGFIIGHVIVEFADKRKKLKIDEDKKKEVEEKQDGCCGGSGGSCGPKKVEQKTKAFWVLNYFKNIFGKFF